MGLAHRLADAAGARVLQYFRQSVDVDNKAGGAMFDPVTRADRECEAVIRDLVAQVWPEHGVIGEEFSARHGASPYSWVIDPIDGTRAFIMGYPDWGILIGLLKGGKPLLGLMDQPFTQERFWTAKTSSYFKGRAGEQALQVRDCAALENALLSTTSPDFFSPGLETERFFALKDKVQMTRYGGDCYAYCLLAAGHIDLIVEAGLKTHDIMPLIPIIERAGGVVTDWNGCSALNGGRVIAAGSKAVHAQALEILAG